MTIQFCTFTRITLVHFSLSFLEEFDFESHFLKTRTRQEQESLINNNTIMLRRLFEIIYFRVFNEGGSILHMKHYKWLFWHVHLSTSSVWALVSYQSVWKGVNFEFMTFIDTN